MSPKASERVKAVLESDPCYVGQGPVVEEFERELAKLTGTPNILTTSSGTAALDLALACLEIGPGDEVISTPMTCSATNHAINNTGATIVWADIDPISGLIFPESVTQAITDRTKAVVVVDWGGERVNFRLGLRRRELAVIVDAAHRAPMGDSRYVPDGNTYIAYSFQAIKFLTTGDGGALVVPSQRYEMAKLGRWFGLDRTSSSDFRCSQTISVKGSKWHMNDIAASIGLANLEGLNDRVARQIAVARAYKQMGLDLEVDCDSHHWVAFIHTIDRTGFQAHMAKRGIATSLVHSRNDSHPVFGRAVKQPMLGLERFDDTYIGIPSGWWLADSEIEHIGKSVLEWESQRGRVEQ
jgi:dTDP-4-amino-4,6-dideoxygalactose transaminase